MITMTVFRKNKKVENVSVRIDGLLIFTDCKIKNTKKETERMERFSYTLQNSKNKKYFCGDFSNLDNVEYFDID